MQLIRHFLFMHRDLSSDLQYWYKYPGTMTCACNSSAREEERRASLWLTVQSVQPLSKLRVQWVTVSKNNMENNWKKHLILTSCFHTKKHKDTCKYMSANSPTWTHSWTYAYIWKEEITEESKGKGVILQGFMAGFICYLILPYFILVKEKNSFPMIKETHIY